MASLERRITRLEQAQEEARNRCVYRIVAAEYGMEWRELQDECEQFLSMPLGDQLAEVDRIHALGMAEGMPWPEVDRIKATLTEHYHP
jgi:hypothetical protein